MFRGIRPATAAIALLTGLFAGCSETPEPVSGSAAADGSAEFETTIRWTSYGIPHVRASDWKGLGYGFAYATARDAVCVIARDLIMVNGEQSRYFGPDDGHLESDVFHNAILTGDRLSGYLSTQSSRSAAFSRGYVAGYNRFLEDHAGRLPAGCRAATWVRPMTDADMARLAIGIGIRYGLGRVQKEMAAAAPPTEPDIARVTTDFSRPAGFGSNAVAFGSALTASGRGLLFGNPHYPWHGSSRFHLIHLTLPGELDVMGVSLLTTSRVSIGFNRDIAWSHTVSTALRSTLYELSLHPEDPLRYRYGDGYRALRAVTVPVTGTDAAGAPVAVNHTVYFSHYGPIVESDTLPWTREKAYAIRDVNLNNSQAAITYDALSRAASVADVEAAISHQGVAWTNTIAADRHGNAFYADISVTPNVDADLLERCRVTPEDVPDRVAVLEGSRPDCEWREDDRSSVPGALPAEEMPRLVRDDFVANSNDSYWLSNPKAPLEGFSPIIGEEGTTRSLRTRAGLEFIAEASAGGRIDAADVAAMLGSHRNYGAELLLDDVLAICTPDLPPVDLDGMPVDVRPACAALAGWDRRMGVDSRGGHVWREFWRLARSIEGIYAVPFDAEDPVNTPRGITTDDPAVRQRLLENLAGAQQLLTDSGIAPDARLGDIQFAERNGERIPIPGGEGWAGMWSMIIADLKAGEGYSHIRHGNSYMQIISWDEDGTLIPQGIVTYSQSPEPDSAHYSDMTRLYARGEWLRLPFEDAEIEADPNLETLVLRSEP